MSEVVCAFVDFFIRINQKQSIFGKDTGFTLKTFLMGCGSVTFNSFEPSFCILQDILEILVNNIKNKRKNVTLTKK